ncbi:MAG TPA: hypothetical protein VE267_01290, partial [Bradyrhizobium sp.]|nr:hypothetical protein [Bradyrhizobium sp.]
QVCPLMLIMIRFIQPRVVIGLIKSVERIPRLKVSCTLHHDDAPQYSNATMGSRLLFVGSIGVREPIYWAANSHGEWVEKTALAGANREIFCFDCGELA